MGGRRIMGRWLCAGLVVVACGYMQGCQGGTPYRTKGMLFAEQKNWDKSVQLFQKALEAEPDNLEIQQMLKRSKWEAAKMHLSRGEAHIKQKMYNEALTELQQCLSLAPGNKKALRLIKMTSELKRVDQLMQQADHDMREKKFYQAKEACQKVLQYQPDNQAALSLLAYFKKQNEYTPEYPLKVESDVPISLKFKKTPLFNVFEVLTKLVRVNFIFDSDVKDSKVTLFLTDVSFNRFIEVLLKTQNLAAKMVNDNTMMIFPNTNSKKKEYEDLQIRTFYLAYIPAKKAITLLSKVLNTRQITTNDELNAIIVRGTQDVIEIASKIIEANDRPTAEVLLNVEILEVNRTREEQLGIEYSEYVSLGIGETETAINKEASRAVFGSLNALDSLTNKELLLSLPIATLNMLKQDTDTQTLANPQIRAKSGETASIHIGERVPLQTNRKVDANNNTTYDYQYQEVGTKLEIEPTVNLHDEIKLKLVLEVSTLGANIGTAQDPQYRIQTRNTKSVLTLTDGEAIIIGGLINNVKSETNRKVPILGDIPGLGPLFFTSQGLDNTTSDIIMAITPTVTKSQDVPGTDITEVWSGNEKDYKHRAPYDAFKKGRESYLDRPVDQYYQDLREKEAESLPEEPQKQPVESPKSSLNAPRPAKEIQKAKMESERLLSRVNAENPAPVAPNILNDWPANIPYSIHVNSFALNEIEFLQARLIELEQVTLKPYVVLTEVPGKGLYYRIFIGEYSTFKTARAACRRLKNNKLFSADIHVADREWGMGDINFAAHSW